MKKIIMTLSILVAALAALVLFSSAFIISEYEQAVVTRFSRPVGVIAGDSPFSNHEEVRRQVEEYQAGADSTIWLETGAGLYFKIPFIERVEIFDDRILEYDSEPAPITSRDTKRLLLDSFARWYIYNPLLFKQNFDQMPLAQNRLDNIIYSALRNRLGEYDFIDIIRSTDKLLEDTKSQIPQAKMVPVKGGRNKIMEEVTEVCRADALPFGIYIIDVRIKRADPPEENLPSIFENMRSERERIAQLYRQTGTRDAEIIKANTDREVKTMLAEAERRARAMEGEADAEAVRIYASGFVKDATGPNPVAIEGFETNPQFYEFLRSLDALEASLDQNTNLILSTENPLLRYLSEPGFD